MALPASESQRARFLPTCSILRERDERLASLIALAGRLAHDFNNLLVPVKGYAALIKEEIPSETIATQYATSIENAARKAEGIVEEILTVARPQRLMQRKRLDFSCLVEKEIKTWEAALAAGSNVTVRLQLQPCSLCVDEAQWQAVLQQLLRNARYALATGGTLDVSLNPVNLQPERAAELGLATLNVMELKLQDSGFGMSELTLRRAFEPFFSTRPKTQALGLGLAIVHGIVRNHGGQIVLESAEDAGTTVHVWLPADSTESETESMKTSTEMPRGFARTKDAAKILVVNDDPLMLEVIKSCLQKARFEVLTAREGKEGLKMFAHHASELALVITDINMPNLNGLELAEQIRQTQANLPILFITGSADTVHDKKLRQLSVTRQGPMRKPFTLKDLVETVKAAVA